MSIPAALRKLMDGSVASCVKLHGILNQLAVEEKNAILPYYLLKKNCSCDAKK